MDKLQLLRDSGPRLGFVLEGLTLHAQLGVLGGAPGRQPGVPGPEAPGGTGSEDLGYQ